MVPNGWEVSQLKDLIEGSIKNGFSPNSADSETGYWVLGLGALGEDGIVASEIKPVAPQDKVLNNLLAKDDFLVSRSNTPDKVGRSVRFRGEVANCSYPDLMMRFRIDQRKANKSFIEQQLKSSKVRTYFRNCAAGSSSTMVKINKGILEKTPVPTPPLQEQKKIAKILSTWDKAIATSEQLLANSQQQKKALMQQLLTGKKRLLDKNGVRYSGEWHDVPLNTMAKVIVSPVDKKTEPNEIPVELCNYTDVYHNHQITRNIKFMKATATKSEIAKYTLHKGDVIITKDSETPGDIAVPALVSEDLKGVVCGYHLAIVRPNIDYLNGAFLNYLFSMQSTRYYFFTLATGATRFGLSVGGINRAHFRVPELAEQEIIAAVLSNADQEISALQQKLNTLKLEK
ncbi:MAG: restriction endonuclease subunit S, partial [Marinospirillum sp.]|uniref:restriction endonuclease subunit S n=1 Tax=Marinospirillum sp. TaxID=2183934 RepID=UPI0019E11005